MLWENSTTNRFELLLESMNCRTRCDHDSEGVANGRTMQQFQNHGNQRLWISRRSRCTYRTSEGHVQEHKVKWGMTDKKGISANLILIWTCRTSPIHHDEIWPDLWLHNPTLNALHHSLSEIIESVNVQCTKTWQN